jgi:enoyl-CoA hydratase/carnithine racemase
VAEEKILLEVDGPLATITLNRADKLNAIDPGMLQQLEEIVKRIEGDTDIRVVLVTGTGDRAFCVGADIHAWSALDPLEMWRHWIRDGHRVLAALSQLRQPVIAALNGYAFGGGLELALAADLRLAAEHAELGFPEVQLGTIPGWGGTQRLPALIGPARAKQMILSGARVPATQAVHWGLVNDAVPGERLVAQARTLAMEIAANAPIAVQAAKQLINGAMGWGTGATLEALASAVTAHSADLHEGVTAFRERRETRFKGN